MIGLVLAAAAVTAVTDQVTAAAPGQLDVIPAAIVEFRAGEAPIVYGQPPTAMLVEVVTPGVGIGYVGKRLELLAGYDLRIAWENTIKNPAPGPLFLHNVNLTMTGRPTRRLVLKLTGTAFEGQSDYTYIASSILPTQTTLATPPKILSANLTGSAELHVTELATAGIALQAVHNQPIDQTAATAYPLPYFTSFAATPGVTVRVSHTDDLSSAIGVQYQHVSDLNQVDASGTAHPGSAVSAFIVSPELGFHRILSPHSEFTLKAGLALTHLESVVEGNSNSVSPIGSAAFVLRLMNLRQAVLQARLTESVDYYLDPILATAADHSYTTAALDLGLPKSWTIALEGSFVTPFEAHPQPQPAGTPPIYYDEIAASAELSARHLLSNDLLLEFGGLWGDRRPFFGAPGPYDTGFHQRQLFVFVRLSGTTHPLWLPKREVAVVQ
jgi:hypothetical protein